MKLTRDAAEEMAQQLEDLIAGAEEVKEAAEEWMEAKDAGEREDASIARERWDDNIDNLAECVTGIARLMKLKIST